MEKFFKSNVEKRWEWCLSRQRVWGVPIPALLCMHAIMLILLKNLLNKLHKVVEKEVLNLGYSYIEDLSQMISAVHHVASTEFKKETGYS